MIPGQGSEQPNQQQEREQIAGKIDRLITISDPLVRTSETKLFVSTRVKELGQKATVRGISVASNPTRGFINPESIVKPSFMVDGFKLDDEDAYTLLLDKFKEYKDTSGWSDKDIREIAPFAVLRGIAEYFGNFTSSDKTEADHNSFYLDRSDATSEPFSIKELKGSGLAVCIEKASLAQNYLSFLGYDSNLLISPNCQLSPGKDDLHAYNTLVSDRGAFIFDSTNPVFVQDADGNVVNFLPSNYPISLDQHRDLISGGQVAIAHQDLKLVNGVYEVQQPVTRIYGGPLQTKLVS